MVYSMCVLVPHSLASLGSIPRDAPFLLPLALPSDAACLNGLYEGPSAELPAGEFCGASGAGRPGPNKRITAK